MSELDVVAGAVDRLVRVLTVQQLCDYVAALDLGHACMEAEGKATAATRAFVAGRVAAITAELNRRREAEILPGCLTRKENTEQNGE